jgi:hypothetical protein
MGKTGEKGLYNMGKRLGTKGGLGRDEFELLLSSNDGAPARDWSILAAQKVRVSTGKDRGDLGLFIGEVLWKRGKKSGQTRVFFGSGLFPYAGWIPGQILVMTGGPCWSEKKQRKEKRKTEGGLGCCCWASSSYYLPHGARAGRFGWPVGPKSAQFGPAAETPFFLNSIFFFPILVLVL